MTNPKTLPVNDIPRQKLREIIATYGSGVVDDPRRCRALLLDYAGKYRREIFVLHTAQEEHVAKDLQEIGNGVPLHVLIAQLTRRLMDNRALTEDAARWAVESWVYALGMPIPAATSGTVAAPAVTPPPIPQPQPPPVPQPSPILHTPAGGTFTSEHNVEVYARPRRAPDAAWQKLGATPGSVVLPPDHVLGLRLFDFDDAAWTQWAADVGNPADVVSLDVNGDVTDDGMASLPAFPNLTYLEIDNAERITDAGMAYLANLPRLVTFSISWGTRITDTGFAYLASLPALANVSLKWAGITDNGVRSLHTLTGLTSLELRECTHLTGTGLESLKSLPNLTSLDLTGAAQLSNAGLQPLGAFKRLAKLTLSHCTRLDRSSLVHLRDLGRLSYLDLSWIDGIGGNDIGALCSLPRLATLSLAHTGLTDTGLGHVGDIPTLIYLDLSWCDSVTDQGLQHLRRLQNLAILNVIGCKRLTQRGLAKLTQPGLYVVR